MTDVTRFLAQIEDGDPRAAEALLPLVYEELRKLAGAQMAREKAGQTLDATALVHEAYLRLVDSERFENRAHFFAAAAQAMRRILIESARRRMRLKHGGDHRRCELSDIAVPMPDERLLALDEALARLAQEDPDAARVVELRFFGGLGHEAIAHAMGMTVYQARQSWTYARAWLQDVLS